MYDLKYPDLNQSIMTFSFLYQNYNYGSDRTPGGRKEGGDRSIQNQETYSGKTCQRIQ